MAKVKIVHTWADGANVTVTVQAATSYPDALAEAKRTALDMLAEAVASLATSGDDE